MIQGIIGAFFVRIPVAYLMSRMAGATLFQIGLSLSLIHIFFQLYRSGEEQVCMTHGDEDQTASPEAARRFAQTFGARLIQVPGGDHSLSGPGMPQLVVREALEFYLAP